MGRMEMLLKLISITGRLLVLVMSIPYILYETRDEHPLRWVMLPVGVVACSLIWIFLIGFKFLKMIL